MKEPDEDPADADEADFNAAIKAATTDPQDDTVAVKSPETDAFPDVSADGQKRSRHPGRQASISLQSKLRSTSFRDTAAGLQSPGAVSLQRVEELERDNKRLAEEAAEHESRWRRFEEQLEELREEHMGSGNKEIEALRTEIEVLKRQQRTGSTTSATGGKASRRESGANMLEDGGAGLMKDLEAKDSTIADMQLEISRLRSQISSQTEGTSSHDTQISALQASLGSAEGRLKSAENELADTKKALGRASEKSVQDGTERTSKDTKLRALERDLETTTTKLNEANTKTAQLEKKIEAMNKLHREAEARTASKLASVEQTSREIPALRTKIATVEAENARIREKHKRAVSGGGADEGLDELEDEGRNKLERRIRELEGQVFDLQRGVWRDQRTAMQPDLAADGSALPSRPSLDNASRIQHEEGFDEVDLSGNTSTSRRPSAFFGNSNASRAATASPPKHSNFTQYLSSGLNAFMAPTSPPPGGEGSGLINRPRNDSLLLDDDDAMFDEAAFARAQQEEEMKKMVAHVREVKRGLGKWKGWRLDLVEVRMSEGGDGYGVGAGEIFEV